MAASQVVLGPTYAEVAPNIVLLDFMQVLDIGILPNSAEVVAAASQPDEALVGKQLVAGAFVPSDKLTEIGTAGKVYARRHFSTTGHAPVYLVFE